MHLANRLVRDGILYRQTYRVASLHFGGATWDPKAYPGAPLAAMAAAPDGSVLYAPTATGIRKSTDQGATWSDTGFVIQALAPGSFAQRPYGPGRRGLRWWHELARARLRIVPSHAAAMGSRRQT